MAALPNSILECRRCPALVACRSRVVPGHGAIPAEVMFVGIAPGRFGGDRTGIPFSGDRSGNLLRQMIARAKIRRVFITNLVRCNPRDDRGRNRDPGRDEIANCREYLESEIETVRARMIVCLGRIPWKFLVGSAAPFTLNQPYLGNGATFYPMYHPGYVIRGAYAERRYARDFARLAKFVSHTTR
jgi:uracil-DNA glycosylase